MHITVLAISAALLVTNRASAQNAISDTTDDVSLPGGSVNRMPSGGESTRGGSAGTGHSAEDQAGAGTNVSQAGKNIKPSAR